MMSWSRIIRALGLGARPGRQHHGHPQDLRDYKQYFLDMQAAVKDAQQAGHADNSEQMVAAARAALMLKYGTRASFPNGIAANVEGVLRWSKE